MSERLVAIDPGLNECGLALFVDGVLWFTELIQSPELDKTMPIDERVGAMANALNSRIGECGATGLIVERMEPRGSRSDAWSSLIDLAMIGGSTLSHGAPVLYLRPSSWTGGRTKKINHLRIRKRLSAQETRNLEAGLRDCPAANHKEILDAVGLGLFHLERL